MDRELCEHLETVIPAELNDTSEHLTHETFYVISSRIEVLHYLVLQKVGVIPLPYLYTHFLLISLL